MLQGESEAEVVALKPDDEEQYLENRRLYAVGKGGLGTVKEEGEASFIDSSLIPKPSGLCPSPRIRG
jgi:hypothetical protein